MRALPLSLRIPVTVAVLVVGLLATACSGGDRPASSPPPATSTAAAGGTAAPAASVTADTGGSPTTQPTATPTPPRDTCPYEREACDLALKLADTLGKRDFTAAATLFTGADVICPGPPPSPSQGPAAVEDAVCQGKTKGDRVRAVLTGLLQTDAIGASLLPDAANALARLFRDLPIPPLYSIGYEGKVSCLECRSVVLADEGGTAVAIRIVREAGGAWGAATIYRGGFSSIATTTIGGRVYHRYDLTAKSWGPELTAKEAGDEYNAVVSAGGDCLNLRNGPGANTAILRCLPDTTAVIVSEPPRPVVEGATTWVTVVLYEGGERISGWASKEFLQRR